MKSSKEKRVKNKRLDTLVMHIGFPKGRGPQADVKKYGDFMGTSQQISALVGTSILFN